jgi:hypothetical protein
MLVNRILYRGLGNGSELATTGATPTIDPVRWVVQAALAVYLLPVLLLLLLVGGVALVASGVGHALRGVGRVLAGPGVASWEPVRRTTRGTPIPHRSRKEAYRLKNRSA